MRDSLVGRTVDGRYRIDARLARGGMATVYLATDLRLDRTVALKVMHGTLAEDPGFVSRFEREARAAARLSHPNVVAVHDQGEDDGLVFLVMEYVPGRTVRDVIREHGALSPAQALVILDPVLEALQAAHRAGFVHRDIKPENVLIADDGRIKVADFGLARAITASPSTAATQGVLIGTVAYLSPEQVERGIADARSDVYGAGILLFEMLTGDVPHGGETPLAVAYQHVNADVPVPSTVRPDVPPAVDDLVRRATRRDPDARFQDAAAFLAAVRAARGRLPAPLPFAGRRDTLVVEPGSAMSPAPVPAAGSGTRLPAASTSTRAAATAVAGTAAGAVPGTAAGTALAAGVAAGDGSRGGVATAAPTSVTSPSTSPRPGSHGVAASLGGPTGPVPAVPRRRRWRGPMALLLVLAIAVGVGTAAWWFGSAQYVPVPAVVGLDEAAAGAKLQAAELGLAVSSRDFSETVDAGLVISADPAPGQEVRRGSEVGVVVSKGPERYAVPDVSGVTPAVAQERLAANSLTLGRTSQGYDESIAKGLAVTIDPKPGTLLKKDTPVTLIVSLGPKPVPVPKLTGVPLAKATATLTTLGLKAATTEAFNDTVPAGSVVSTTPKQGTAVPKGGTVTLLVSKGPPPVRVPNVVDRGRAEAVRILRDAGLRVSIEEPLGVTPLDRVLRQSPGGGDTVPKGTTVVLQIV